VANTVGQTFGFAVGTALAALLLALVCRSGGSDRGARFFFSVSILIANLAGLVKSVAHLTGRFDNIVVEREIHALGFAAAAMVPATILSVWRNTAVSAPRRKIGNWLVAYAVFSGIVIGTASIMSAWDANWLSTVPKLHFLRDQDSVGNLTFYNGLATFSLAGFALLPGTLKSTVNRVAIALMFAGLLISSISAAVAEHTQLSSVAGQIVNIAKFQGILLMVVGTFFYFSRFRAADIFAKYAIRLILGATLALLSTLAYLRLFPAQVSTAGAILSATAIVCCALLLYTRIERSADLFVERRIFGRRDTRLALRGFREHLGLLGTETDVLAATHQLAAELLGMNPNEMWTSMGPHSPENDKSLSLPIPTQSNSPHLVVSLAGNRSMLLTAEIELLQEISLHTGRRLDELRREEERIEAVRHEELLNRQLVQTELRALRAQINPHFLFNSLNTIIALIEPEPQKAERITARLASIFRYVLIHADQPFSSLDEEMEFLRTYLDVEQIRFGERLVVEFDVDSSVKFIAIPSLILQPLVENSIKHGIAPKIGKSRIIVRAKRQTESVLLTVEDNGIGFPVKGRRDSSRLARSEPGAGIGLQNIRERLQAIYGESATLTLAGLESGGCRASLDIPINGVANANSGAARG
jgi:two-component system LytT family sensor kinase